MNRPDYLAGFAPRQAPDPEQVEREHERAGLALGALVGLIFALAAWGPDGSALARSHGLWPWLKFALAVLPCLMLGGLAGWLHIKSRRGAGLLLWVGAALVVCWSAGRLPYDGVSAVLARLAPDLARLAAYDFGSGPQTRQTLAVLLGGGAWLVGGLLFPGAVEAYRAAVAPLSRWLPFALAALFFALGGTAVDFMVNRPLRDPVITIDTLIRYRLDHRDSPVDPATARELHLAVFNPVQDLLPRPRRLILGSVDDTIEVVGVLVDFQGAWARCTLTVDQPSFCERSAAP